MRANGRPEIGDDMLLIRKCLLDQFLDRLCFGRRIGVTDTDAYFFYRPVTKIFFQVVDQFALPPCSAKATASRIDSSTGHAQDGLEAEKIAEQRGTSPDPAATSQVIEVVDHEENPHQRAFRYDS